ncbi:sugar ABC transporter substrate-binding protein [Nocardia brasiliensis]|uniref:D-xylose-binding periplasmic ABC transporter protein n=1 Tax=Nocardia brasiliensis (strain ATCC 700358 / HUJEG-1) TaxID=1133849 RepID=K0EJ14_NOCB7|nr:substrate-binding domain-containing protein [Nocardia brasiliensis]AFT99332.1 D-xylose-binding periplasmic ABC transporter protein [Nocardia brasiliensis ATCC 700358]OCF90305.1 sugar ABC transporter substrate-binding protein [Nocardia brasiliensis]
MRKGILGVAAVSVALLTSLTACGDDSKDSGGGAKIGVILPDSKTSARWETADRKYLQQAFDSAGVKADIQNAQGDKNAFQTIADQMMTNGASVLLMTNLDSGTGKAVIQKAKAQGVTVIDYDRLTLGGGAQFYVSFDNVKVGSLLGSGVEKCLTDKKAVNPVVAYLNGGPTDNNATLLKQGYDSVLKPKFDAGQLVKGPDQAVPEWDNTQAGTIFEQMLTGTPNIGGVVAANDGLANAAIAVLKKQKLNGQVPVSGQDATVQGLQNVLKGDQCLTVYKAIKKEAEAAAELAIALTKGQQGQANGSVKDPESKSDVPSVLLEPKPIYAANVKDVVADGYVTKDELCTGEFAKLCADNGI